MKQIKMTKDGAWMINGKATVFTKGQLLDLSEELADKIVESNHGLLVKPQEPVLDKPRITEELINSENKDELKLNTKVIEDLDQKEERKIDRKNRK